MTPEVQMILNIVFGVAVTLSIFIITNLVTDIRDLRGAMAEMPEKYKLKTDSDRFEERLLNDIAEIKKMLERKANRREGDTL